MRPDAATRLRVTYLGRIDPGKGVRDVVALFRELARDGACDLRISGYIWPDSDACRRLHEELLADETLNYQPVEHDCWSPEIDAAAARMLHETDILVLPYDRLSSTVDMPVLLLEGMAAGCAVLTKPLGNIPDIYGESPFLVSARDFVAGAAEVIRGCREEPGTLRDEQRRVHARASSLGLDREGTFRRLSSIVALDGPAGLDRARRGPMPTQPPRPRGMFVAIIGPDGSGKTTLAEGLAREARGLSFTGSEHVRGNFGILPRLRQVAGILAGRRIPRDFGKRVGEYHQGMAPPNSLPRAMVYLCYYWWDFMLGHLVVRRARRLGRLVIADRYFFDYYYQRGSRRLPRWLVHLANRFVPRPYLVFCLRASAGDIHARKPELSVDEIQREMDIIEDIAPRIGRCVWLDSGAGTEGMVTQATGILRSCLEHMSGTAA